jgi:serine/threonine-protein kinase
MEARDQVDKYEVIALLGEGGFADVYRVRHIHLGTEHALKVLKREFVEKEELRQRFLDEGRVQARLEHPHIVRVTDIVAIPGTAGLVMQFLQGQSLASVIEERAAPFDEQTIAEIMLPVFDALHFAHERGVIHRDIKPDNIFLADHPEGGFTPKLLDFGIARVRA